MIDIAEETILSLGEATRAVPAIEGKHPNASTIFRWTRDGVRGVRLDSIRLGRRLCTSREALQRFVVALNDAPAPQNRPRTATGTRTAAQRERDVTAAKKRLADRGLVEAGGAA